MKSFVELSESLQDCSEKGMCFRNAQRKANEIDGELIDKARAMGMKGKIETDVLIVHGMVTNPSTGDTFAHAWVEVGDVVHDPTIGIAKKKSWYYKRMKVKVIAKYKTDHVMIHAIRTGNYGPWTKKEVGNKYVEFKSEKVAKMNEDYYTTSKGYFSQSDQIDIYKNPTKKEIIDLRRSGLMHLRGFITRKGDVYFGSDGVHGDWIHAVKKEVERGVDLAIAINPNLVTGKSDYVYLADYGMTFALDRLDNSIEKIRTFINNSYLYKKGLIDKNYTINAGTNGPLED